MQIVIIIGPHAVGKMTVGQALAQQSGWALFHNHVAIDIAAPYFDYSEPAGRELVHQLRAAFFDAFAASDASGYILTFVWAFGEPGEQEYIEGITAKFEAVGADVLWVELEADLETRLARNRTENRLAHKPTKRDLVWSEANLRRAAIAHRLNSHPGEITRARYLRIDTTQRDASEVAQRIYEKCHTAG